MTQSSENTEPVPAEAAGPVARHLPQVREPSVVDLQVTALQNRLEVSEDARKEERFMWFAFSGALILALIFIAAGVTAGTILSLVYFAMLIVLSRKWGFEAFWEALYAARDLIKGRPDKTGRLSTALPIALPLTGYRVSKGGARSHQILFAIAGTGPFCPKGTTRVLKRGQSPHCV